ncbi:MAG: hypothetical protein U0X39_06885 [Bacteroidales bacterium]
MIPNLSLNRPATLFDLNLAKGKLSFEPQLRFGLDAKPWTFIFWWRYKLVDSGPFRITAGAHPAFSFKTKSLDNGISTNNYIVVRRYLAGELYPTYSLTKSITTGVYYLYSRGLDFEATRNTNLLALRLSFNNIRLSEKYFAKFLPQVYYLRMDKLDGTYYTSTLSFARKEFPLSVSSVFCIPFKTSIPQPKEIIWSVSIIYAMNKEYLKKKVN